MHLSDNNLLELGKQERAHLQDCEICRERAKTILELRNNIVDSQQYSAQPPPWKDIQKSLYEVQKEQQIQQAEKKTAFWKITSLALAASLATVAIWSQLFNSSSENLFVNEQASLLALIEDNKQLQQQVALKQLNPADFKTLQTQLEVVDKALQQAYLQQLTEEEKLELWQLRLQILQYSLTTKKNSNILRI